MSANKKQINGIDVYVIECPRCKVTFDGRFAYPTFVGADGRYCDTCANLKIWSDDEGSGPDTCPCGGKFDSFNLICPSCNRVIGNAEKQLAVQFYVVEPCKVAGNPSDEEKDVWYEQRRREGFLTGTELFVQLANLLLYDKVKRTWRYYGKFEK